jgi:hypothetical protein
MYISDNVVDDYSNHKPLDIFPGSPLKLRILPLSETVSLLPQRQYLRASIYRSESMTTLTALEITAVS